MQPKSQRLQYEADSMQSKSQNLPKSRHRQQRVQPRSSARRLAKTPKIILPIMAGMLLFSAPMESIILATPAAHAAAATKAVTYKMVKTGENIITSGAKEIIYSRVPSSADESVEVMHVIEIDLTNPYVKVNAMAGKGGSVTQGQSVTAMAKETGAVAGINGDVFNTTGEGVPIGAQIQDGQLLVSTSKVDGLYSFALTKDRQPIIDRFEFKGTVLTDSGAQFELSGVNKQLYWMSPNSANSHVDRLYLYTSAWTAPERPANTGTKPTEALIVDGFVQEVSVDQPIATPIPENGYILRGHGKAAQFIINNMYPGSQASASYSLVSLTSGQSYNPADFQMMVGGHTILVDQGKAAEFSRDIRGVSGSADRARTAVGFSQDGKKLYLVTVEENSGRKGVTLKELQQMLLDIGVWKAVNMDGGGSTTMVTRPLGDTNVTLTHPTNFGVTQRQVANGIGVYSTAPQGELKGIVASGSRTLFIGQEASYKLKAYDTYYNPVDPNGLQPEWSISDTNVGSFQDGKLVAAQPGKASITVKAGEASDSLDVEVIGQDQIERLTVEPSTTLLQPGSTISVPVKARLKDGREVTVPASSLSWEFKGFTASVQDGKLTVESVNDGTQYGFAIARYDGLGTAAILAPGTEKMLETFEKSTYAITFSGLPAETVGSVGLSSDVPGRESSRVLTLAYDFTTGTGNRFAYANFNKDKGGVSFDGTPSAMTLDVLGDASMNWLRAEFIDKDGKAVLVDVAKMIDWSGWKTVRVDLAAAGLKGPGKLTRLYVVNLEQDQDERALQGEIAFDNIALQYPPKPFAAAKPKIVMQVGKRNATIDGKTAKLPDAPFMKDGVNYLPLRFVTETLGAEVLWDNKAKRVTVLRGDTMVELWVGSKEITVNGVRQTVLAAPMLKNNSTYVPVRVVSEQLGQQVDWDGKTKTITIH